MQIIVLIYSVFFYFFLCFYFCNVKNSFHGKKKLNMIELNEHANYLEISLKFSEAGKEKYNTSGKFNSFIIRLMKHCDIFGHTIEIE